MSDKQPAPSDSPQRQVPVDWEALEDAFENNAPEVHSYLHVVTGDVLRVVDGVANPDMHARIAADPHYLRVDPVSSREQYRWMERFIPMVDTPERWFSFRSERLRTFMEAWLGAHALAPVPRVVWTPEATGEPTPEAPREDTRDARRLRALEGLRRTLRDAADSLGVRDLETLVAFADFLRARRSRSPAPGGEPLDESAP